MKIKKESKNYIKDEKYAEASNFTQQKARYKRNPEMQLVHQQCKYHKNPGSEMKYQKTSYQENS